jgi:hypothetical protein
VTLIDRRWTIVHPVDWPVQERGMTEARLNRDIHAAVSFEQQDAIPAGLRISAGGAVVDGTVEGLLHHASRIEAMLLARINRHRGGGA